MARKWERMVEKNKKQTNKRRLRQGQMPILEAGQEAVRTFKGRSWALPLFLVAIALFFSFVQGEGFKRDNMYWFTIISYIVLALIFFLRRPFLRIGKTKLTTRRFGGDRSVNADQVDEITIMNRYVIVQLKPRKTKWVFSQLMHRYELGRMAEAVKEFAARNNIPVKDETITA